MSRDTLSSALEAECIPVFTAYGRMLPEHPSFQNKIAFGKNNYPWSLTKAGNNIDYSPSLFPNAEKLIKEEFVGFLTLGWPNGEKEMDMIAESFR